VREKLTIQSSTTQPVYKQARGKQTNKRKCLQASKQRQTNNKKKRSCVIMIILKRNTYRKLDPPPHTHTTHPHPTFTNTNPPPFSLSRGFLFSFILTSRDVGRLDRRAARLSEALLRVPRVSKVVSSRNKSRRKMRVGEHSVIERLSPVHLSTVGRISFPAACVNRYDSEWCVW